LKRDDNEGDEDVKGIKGERDRNWGKRVEAERNEEKGGERKKINQVK